jgi:hypothetical protein
MTRANGIAPPGILTANQAVDEGLRTLKGEVGKLSDKAVDMMTGNMNPYGRGIPRTPKPVLSPAESKQFGVIDTLGQAAGQAKFRETNRIESAKDRQALADHKARVEAVAAQNPGLNAQALSRQSHDLAAKGVLDPGSHQTDALWRQQKFANVQNPNAVGPVPPSAMSPSAQLAQQLAGDVDNILNARGQIIQNHGVNLAYNPLSNAYYPRNANAVADELNYDILQNILNVQPDILPKHGGSAHNFKPRNQRSVPLGQMQLMPGDPGYAELAKKMQVPPGTPVANPAFNRPVDIAYDLGSHTFQTAQLDGFKEHIATIERLTGKRYDQMPPQLKQSLVASYPAQYQALRGHLDELITGESKRNKAGIVANWLADNASNAWRRVTLPWSAAHNTMNTVGDITTGLATTVSPADLDVYLDAGNFLERGHAGQLTGAELADYNYVRKYGLADSDTLQRLDIRGGERAKNVVRNRQALGEDPGFIANAEQKLADVRGKLPEWVPLGATYGDWWEPINKTALYLNARRAGKAPEQAIAEALKVGINYGKPLPSWLGSSGTGLGAKAQAHLFPFAKYAIRAPEAVMSEFPGNIKRLVQPSNAMRDTTQVTQDGRNEVSGQTGKYGYGVPMPGIAGRVANSLIDATGGPSSNDTKVPFYMRPPQGGLDALELPAQLFGVAQTAVDSGLAAAGEKLGRDAASKMGPVPKAIVTALTGLNPTTLEPERPGAPDGLYGAMGAAGDFVLPRDMQYPLNRGIEAIGGRVGRSASRVSTTQGCPMPWCLGSRALSVSRCRAEIHSPD